jgi:hypothetical protein
MPPPVIVFLRQKARDWQRERIRQIKSGWLALSETDVRSSPARGSRRHPAHRVLRGGGAALSVTPSAVSQRSGRSRRGSAPSSSSASNPPAPRRPARGSFAMPRRSRCSNSAGSRRISACGGGRARLRIAVNADSLATWLLPALAEAGEALFEIVVDDQDHSADLLRRGEVAAAVTAEAAPIQGCDAGLLGRCATSRPAPRPSASDGSGGLRRLRRSRRRRR